MCLVFHYFTTLMIMKHQKVFDITILIFKILSLLAFTIIFLYWSIAAIIKFKSKPTTSSISYTFGDDGHGHYEFPAITICLPSFNWITKSPNGMQKKCSRTRWSLSSPWFYKALMMCTFPPKKPQIKPFKKIEDFLNISNMLEITDILRFSRFGKIFPKNSKGEELKKVWLPSLNFKKGAFHKLHSF